ncbi:30S ribosomal protein S12 methylthiotransferase RimO [Desulforhopalus sp. IMCC35007]|uniref:30S ribosomal protein S12 methylthiotransferase RimO n=1 Tax=Desulforhopalus sp. IMCC35007 TaxID=2569543 RepID=UPI0010ADB4A8|nr:30S ribosomal protein S12 methylthiotransferase RimO [Desulforhopalus sp. IMCC35007]TKB12179.1 30S ribosomal protein S12 methylthiotransferase RimO [Desulforhopalus sp. IMCC35007]
MAGSFHLISLGCAKNLVDSEVMLGALAACRYELENEIEQADFLIVNTCGFIQPAVEEAIAEILELVALKEQFPTKKIVVVGCLVQRYGKSLATELPEVDLFIGTEGPARIGKLLDALVKDDEMEKVVLPERYLMDSNSPRILSTPRYRAWLKITEGCNNRCSYCMIPSIRGKLRSRRGGDLIAEAVHLEKMGVKELSLIAQDSTAYGNDLGKSDSLENLMNGLLSSTSIPWFRLLYLYPTGVTDRLLDLIAENERIVPYLDIPFQHVNDRVLGLMNRPYGHDFLVRLVEKIRAKIPNIALRTTFLVGFPGETEAEFLQIEKFLQEIQLDHVGVFPYTNEEGAPSENFTGQLDDAEKIRRMEHLLQIQAPLSQALQQKYIGQVLPVLVEGVSSETDLLLEGRTMYQAPEVDGRVYINDGMAQSGDIVQVEITDAQIYDLVGGIVV